MNRPDRGDLIAKALREDLSEAEKQEWARLLEQEPELRAIFAEELALERALDHLPNVPISSNFTALTVQAALRAPREKAPFWQIRLPFLHTTFARAVALLVGLSAIGVSIGIRYQRAEHERADMARNVRSFTEVASVFGSDKTQPEEVFQNFDAIQRLPVSSDGDVDLELLVALQK